MTTPAQSALSVTTLCFLAGVHWACAREEPQIVKVAPRQLAVSVTCDAAKSAVNSSTFASLGVEDRDQVLITIGACAAAEHNKEHPDDPQIIVVGANPNLTYSDDKVFMKTIPLKQTQAVQLICEFVGRATFAFLNKSTPVAASPKVLVGAAGATTDKGPVECGAFLRELGKDNPMVVFAPQIISGVPVTINVLRMIGAQKPAAEVQQQVDEVDKVAGNVVARGEGEVKSRPLILLAGPAASLVTGSLKISPLPKANVSCKLTMRCELIGANARCHNMCD